MQIKKYTSLQGEVTVPGDKSISHRSIMLGALAEGKTIVRGFLQGADCLSSIACFEKMGIQIENDKQISIDDIEATIRERHIDFKIKKVKFKSSENNPH